MAKTIVTQYGEFLNYDNIVKIGIITNWEDAEINEESGTIAPDYEMIGTDTGGTQIPMGNYKTPEEAETALKDLYEWLSSEAYAVYEMYSQLFNLLCTKADNSKGGKLKYHVRCLLDEFSNIGEIPQFEKLIATIRNREISASIILQAKSQLKAIYKDNADTIEGNCDTMLFLGGKEKITLKEISESLGKETIDSFNTSTNEDRAKATV